LLSALPHILYFHSFPTRRSSDLTLYKNIGTLDNLVTSFPEISKLCIFGSHFRLIIDQFSVASGIFSMKSQIGSQAAAHNRQRIRSEEHTSELQSRENLVCRLLLE